MGNNQRKALDEIATNPGVLTRWAQGPEAADMVVGFEAEMLVRGLVWPDDDNRQEDRDMDETMPDSFSRFADDIDDWFSNGNNFHEESGLRRALRMLERDYREYATNQWENDRDDDEWQDRIRSEVASELGVEEGDELVDEQIETEGYAYRSAVRTVRDEYIDDNDDVWQDYLRANGLRMMSDFANEYNLDWPYTAAGESSVTPEELEASFTRKTGYACQVNETYHGSRPRNSFVMEPDSSLTGEDDYGGLELISPPMPLASAMVAIDRVFDWMEATDGIRTGWRPPTGFHIGVSMGKKGIESVDKLKLILMMGDDHVLKQFGRERLSRYAASSYKHIRDNIMQPGFDIESELSKFRSFLDMQASKDLSTMLSGGMRRENTVSMRPSQGYVEFRSPGGDYLKQRGEIKNTVLRFARALSIAADPEAEKKEYAKKLYQLLTAGLDKRDDAIETFAAYSSGLMSREDLSNAIDAYRKRRGGTTDARVTWNVVDDATGKVLGSIVSDDDNLHLRLRSWAERNNRSYNSVDAVRPGQEKKLQTYRVSQNYGPGERFDIDARSPAEALKYAKARWGVSSRPDGDFTVVDRSRS